MACIVTPRVKGPGAYDTIRAPAALRERRMPLFHLDRHRTTVRREILAGCTTFLTMAYIMFLNPAILAEADMDFGAVFVATCLSAAFGSFVMGLLANYPVALAPGMGLNAFFTFVVVQNQGASWQTALGAVFV